ncbi:putative secreted protein (Por secretion system target) [Jejuia pallidilutea]|uniref:Putative secreted protein (Por secretion system target) n=1 Tax=Jejuia pallidilutea TaxID=504487 RepID=A0A362X0F1_9FLAO|nr:T9SS type A sorting domain-containing protein [Jejuia pallidilutea]PQV46522.1 putative secreted protein (Por secretion system target) [Jejuia pallidilutea]
MKKLLLILCTFYLTNLTAQTTLAPGDIMFIGLNADSAGNPLADEFNVLFLEPVTLNTEIYFTDMGYTGNSAPYFQQNVNNGCSSSPITASGAVSDGMVKWTATSDVAAGTQLVIRVRITGVIGATCNIGSVSVVVNPQNENYAMSLSGGGEAVHAFQGAINSNNQVTSATMLASILYDDASDAWDANVTTCQFSSSDTEDPATGFEVEYVNHFDNGYYSGDLTLSKTALQTAILDMTNWTRSNTTTYEFPISGTLGNSTFSNDSEVIMYPNPSNNYVFFTKNIEKIIVYDSLGRAVIETHQNKCNIKSLKPGIYLVKIKTLEDNNTIVKRLIKE